MASQSPRKVFIVTGGASGIGLGITRYLLTQHPTLTPAHIAILDINTSTGTTILSSLREEYKSASPNTTISFHQCDVSSWESQAAAFKEVFQQQGRVDYVVANAGITEKGNLLQVDEREPVKPSLATLDVNLVGVIYSVKLALHYIRKNAGPTKGGIICTASNAGLYAFPMAPIYATTKHGVVGFVRSLARPLALEGIQINALAPAVIETNIASSLDLFKNMIITPMSTVTKAVEILLTTSPSPNPTSTKPLPETTILTGKIAECHEGNVTFAEQPAYVDENTGKNIEMFWNLGYA
ncbi:short chain dehydrogenase/reductase, putative [Talaromyces stipitatus ATCC 10500]|uniref:Short chain dehydrogenase/reductase, putative n=1 Tax=Talaromyces stipitatus (strain ATCC 10500 / CBS 375.48 / QM 6759 / NRRL 1006) TaxID=441959 RepID=B8ML06_TALSN|nr:short chain dehydrogenase/reductase, putative [Talaromyces stipitatus ATCC 10500]EED15422.1 short chain dehydrogenase/reductase, putative [Talaromyces stipitatus ATCC 10500]